MGFGFRVMKECKKITVVDHRGGYLLSAEAFLNSIPQHKPVRA